MSTQKLEIVKAIAANISRMVIQFYGTLVSALLIDRWCGVWYES